MEWLVVVVALGAATAVVALRRQKARATATSEFARQFWFCSLDEFRALIASGADVDGVIQGYKPGNWHRPLHTLATRGDDDLTHMKIKELLRNGAEVNGLDSEGQTPLVRLVQSASAEGDWGKTAALLISSGANTALPTNSGVPLLHAAARSGRPSVAHALLEVGADINARAPLTSHLILNGELVETDRAGNEVRRTQGAAPIHFAAISASVDVARLLQNAGADLNAKTDNGDTPRAIIEAMRVTYDKHLSAGETYPAEYGRGLEDFESLLRRL